MGDLFFRTGRRFLENHWFSEMCPPPASLACYLRERVGESKQNEAHDPSNLSVDAGRLLGSRPGRWPGVGWMVAKTIKVQAS